MLNSLLSFITLSEDDFGAIAGILLAILVFGGYLAICAAVGKFAKNRGRSFFLFFFISFFFNPIIGFIFAALLGESNRFREERIRREARILMEEQQRYRQQDDESQSSYN